MRTRAEASADYPAPGQLLAGEFVPAQGRRCEPVFDPSTGATLGLYAHATEQDLERALGAAQQGFDRWRRCSAFERAHVLNEVARGMRAERNRLAELVVLELGKPWAEALAEVEQAAGMWDWAAEEGKRAYGRIIPSREAGTRQMVLREPVGPVAAFSSWNAPLITPSRKMAGALGVGCSIIVKGSEETPACVLALGRIACAAGLPEGTLSIVFGDPQWLSERLIESAVIRCVTFTGSTRIGKQLAAAAVARMKRPIMELGGHAPVLIFDDIDIDRVVAGAITSKYRNSGQICVSPTRFFVQRKIYEDFAAAFAAHAAQRVVGDGFDALTTMGPLASARRVTAMNEFVADARERGLRLLYGGAPVVVDGFERGNFYAPTVIADAGVDAMVSNVEPFGPIAMIAPFDNIEQGLALANRLPFALAAYVMTDRTGIAERCASEIESGSVIINGWRVSLPETPFGGHKDSGLASEGGIEGLQAFQNLKYVSQS